MDMSNVIRVTILLFVVTLNKLARGQTPCAPRETPSECLIKTCHNGYCNIPSLICVCDVGWTGDLCDTCSIVTEPPYVETIPTNSTMTADMLHVDGDAAPVLLEQCVPRTTSTKCVVPTCYNGDCHTDFFNFRCVCDAGWIGHECDICCDKQCTPNQGVCALNQFNEMFCDCFDGFTGDNCSLADSSSSDERSTTTTIVPTPQEEMCAGSYVQAEPPTDCLGLDCYRGKCEIYGDTANCVCDPGWAGYSCQVCCDLSCNNGRCAYYQHSGQIVRYCDCHDGNYTTESNCTERRTTPTIVVTVTVPTDPETPEWLYYVAGTGGFLLFVLILTVTILPYYLWRKRALIMIKIVHYFQKYDDPDRPFHVFISYADSDEDRMFVYRKLFPKLENEMNYKVCLKERDFVPGGSIADTIIEAIKSSNRTILVVSRAYCKEDLSQFEYQVAQDEMNKLRHSVVPIILEDISDVKREGNMANLLKYIVDTSRKIKWPGTDDEKMEAKFWTRVRLAMPKLKPEQETPFSSSALTESVPRGMDGKYTNSRGGTIGRSTSYASDDDVFPDHTSLDSGYYPSPTSTGNFIGNSNGAPRFQLHHDNRDIP